MTTVYWTPSTRRLMGQEPVVEADILFEEPKPLSKELIKEYKGYEFTTCPAFVGFCKNTFVITAPIDGVITISKTDEITTMQISGFGWTQDLYDTYCWIRDDGSLTLPPTYIFYADEPLEMETLPVFLLDSPSLENAFYIPASFDIGSWIRPIDFSFIPKDSSKTITMKRGDPLFFIRFNPKDGEKIMLERVECTQELIGMVISCTNMKHRLKNMTLPELYKLAKSHIQLFVKRRKNT